MRVSGPPVYSLTGGKVDFTGPATWVDPRTQPLANDALPNMQSRTFDGLTLRVRPESATTDAHLDTPNVEIPS